MLSLIVTLSSTIYQNENDNECYKQVAKSLFEREKDKLETTRSTQVKIALDFNNETRLLHNSIAEIFFILIGCNKQIITTIK